MTTLGCPLFPRCPGCGLGAVSYRVGLERKAGELTRAIAAYPELKPEVAPARGAAPTHAYRLRAKLVASQRALGLFERGAHRVVDIAGCSVLAPELAAAADALRHYLPLPIYGADLRATTEGVLLTLLTDQPRARLTLEATAAQLLHHGIRSVAIAVREPENLRLLAGEPEVVAGPSLARHRLSDDLPYAYAAHGGFVQAHAGQASYVQRAIVERLRSRLGVLKGRHIVELFAGSGALALALAREGARVTAVEAFAPAIELAHRAAVEQGVVLEGIAADATKFLSGQPPSCMPDAILVNPPRRGLARELRAAIAAAKPVLVGYVSCNPRTLARDCGELAVLGLSLSSVEPLDMIPWSDAVEALAWLEPRPAPLPHVLYDDEASLAVDKRSGESLSALRERVRRLPGCGGAVALETWSSEMSGVCWFAKCEDALPQLRNQLAESEREVVVLVRGNLRKQGTITRRGQARGTRYKKLRDAGRHSLAMAHVFDGDETQLLRDFASIGRAVLGDARFGDRRSNEHMDHRHGLDRAFIHCSTTLLQVGNDIGPKRIEAKLAPELVNVLGSLDSD